MGRNLKFKLPDGHNQAQLINNLAAHLSIKKEPAVVENLALYDTFDWRLFNKSLVLSVSGKKLCLQKLNKDEIVHSIDIPSPPVFLGDFPDGALKTYLAPIIKMRSLLKLADIQSRSAPYRVLNRDEKTVAHIVFQEIRSARNQNAPALMAFVRINPVRGYPKYSQTLAKRCKAEGLTPNKERSIYTTALAAAGKKPGSYSSKVNVRLDPRMPSGEAAREILRFLLQIMRLNQPYIEKDLDTEFLHDFRVSIRRTRSALGQIKSVFPVPTTNRFKKDFAYIGKLSNQLRDLDVYLLKEQAYKDILPAVLRADIDPLFAYLRKKRARALRKVVGGMKTKKYADILKDWETFLNDRPKNTSAAANADLPIMNLARERIFKKYKNVVKSGSQIVENTEDAKLHALRIECKKLRYLMEFFASLFPVKKTNVLIDQLKKLQDNLGDFNDFCVQEDYLLNIAQELPADHRQGYKTLLAIGSLIGALDNKKRTVKEAFAGTFTDFASPANQALFRELFASKV